MVPQYENYVNLIKQEAWKRVKRQPNLDFDELVGQGNIAFCLAVRTWNPEKGSFSTHLSWQIQNQMKTCNLLHREDEDWLELIIGEASLLIKEDVSPPDKALAFKLGLENLGNEAQEICSILFNSSGEFCDFTTKSIKVTQTNIKRYFRSLNWPIKKINFALYEIKKMLKSL